MPKRAHKEGKKMNKQEFDEVRRIVDAAHDMGARSVYLADSSSPYLKHINILTKLDDLIWLQQEAFEIGQQIEVECLIGNNQTYM